MSGTAPRTPPPPPVGISPEAQQALLHGGSPAIPYPPVDDIDAWVALIDSVEAWLRPGYEAETPDADRFELTDFRAGDATVYAIRSTSADDTADSPLFLDIHGGGFFIGGGELAWRSAAARAVLRPGVTWSPDYRMPPHHRHPAALDDVLAAYRAALEVKAPEHIVVFGGSAGAGLAPAMLLRARDAGLPMPAGQVLLSPAVDLTESGDTFATNLGIDTVLAPIMPVIELYAGGADLAHPSLSALFGDLRGLPPTFLQSGTRDLLLSNTVRMHRRLLAAGVEAELHVWDAMPHGSFGGAAPEDRELVEAFRAFEDRVLGVAR